MRWIERVRRRFGLFRPHRDVEGEVDAELRFHMTAYAEDLMRRGHSEEDARRRVLREFGDMAAARTELVEIDRRRARRIGVSDLLLDARQDVRFAMRMMLRRPGFAVSAVVMLALGIGATTAIFSVVDAALLRPLPFEDPGRLAVVWGVAGPERDIRGGSYPEIRDWEELTRSFSDLAYYDETSLNLSGGGGGEAERLEAEFVSPGYFRLLGVLPRLGRGFTADDDRPGVAPSVVISHSPPRPRTPVSDRSCSASSPFSRSPSPRSASTASWRSWSRRGAARSRSASRSAPSPRACSAWSCARAWRWSRSVPASASAQRC